jgi:hypothetical protein
MAGHPDPAGKPPGLFGAMQQGSGGNTAGPSFGGGGNATFFPQRGDTSKTYLLSRTLLLLFLL